MSINFEKLKAKIRLGAIVRFLALGLALGALTAAGIAIAQKLAALSPDLLLCVGAGAGVAVIVIAIVFLVAFPTEKRVAKRLDDQLSLNEKVQTMLAFEGEGGDMLALQRADANVSLSAISVSELKIKKIWIYITALAVAAAILLAGFLVPNIWKKNQNPPYRLTEYQEAGVLELIRYVDASGMEEQYRVVISQELRD